MSETDFPVRRALALRTSGIHGKGVFAREPIPAGTRIIEYRGVHRTRAEAEALYPYDPSVPYHTFLFQIDDDLIVDAAEKGNLARWINHSCDPNCDAVIDGDRIFIESIRDIEPGEELSYDYNFILEERHTPSAKRRFPCACGAEGCRGTMLGKKR